jgi:hypothetical protein
MSPAFHLGYLWFHKVSHVCYHCRFGNLQHIATEESQANTQLLSKCGGAVMNFFITFKISILHLNYLPIFQDLFSIVLLYFYFSEMEVICSKQDDVLSSKDKQIKDLKQRLANQKQNHKQRLSELEIQRQQERYIVMNTQLPKDGSKKTKPRRVTFR